MTLGRYIGIFLFGAVLVGAQFGAAQAQGAADDATVVGVAAGTPDFSTLVSALSAAGLTETLQGSGPFTVFAPTNEAFAKLSDDALAELLADREALVRVLTYHVVPGSFTTSDITEGMTSFMTLEGAELPITQQGVGDAAVTAVNIPASNGVIFAIDTVLTPPVQTTDDAASSAASGGTGLYSSSAEASERYTLEEVDGSGVSGSVLVAEYSADRTVISISLSGTPAGGLHPATLYTGSCSTLGDEVTGLEPVSGDTGFGTTVLDVPFADVVSSDHALNIGMSENDDTAAACGEVGQ